MSKFSSPSSPTEQYLWRLSWLFIVSDAIVDRFQKIGIFHGRCHSFFVVDLLRNLFSRLMRAWSQSMHWVKACVYKVMEKNIIYLGRDKGQFWIDLMVTLGWAWSSDTARSKWPRSNEEWLVRNQLWQQIRRVWLAFQRRLAPLGQPEVLRECWASQGHGWIWRLNTLSEKLSITSAQSLTWQCQRLSLSSFRVRISPGRLWLLQHGMEALGQPWASKMRAFLQAFILKGQNHELIRWPWPLWCGKYLKKLLDVCKPISVSSQCTAAHYVTWHDRGLWLAACKTVDCWLVFLHVVSWGSKFVISDRVARLDWCLLFDLALLIWKWS